MAVEKADKGGNEASLDPELRGILPRSAHTPVHENFSLEAGKTDPTNVGINGQDAVSGGSFAHESYPVSQSILRRRSNAAMRLS